MYGRLRHFDMDGTLWSVLILGRLIETVRELEPVSVRIFGRWNGADGVKPNERVVKCGWVTF